MNVKQFYDPKSVVHGDVILWMNRPQGWNHSVRCAIDLCGCPDSLFSGLSGADNPELDQ